MIFTGMIKPLKSIILSEFWDAIYWEDSGMAVLLG